MTVGPSRRLAVVVETSPLHSRPGATPRGQRHQAGRALDKRAGGSRTAKVRESLKNYVRWPEKHRGRIRGSFLTSVRSRAKQSPASEPTDSKLITVVSGQSRSRRRLWWHC